MPQFLVRCFDPATHAVVEALVEATSEAAARARAPAPSQVVLSVTPVTVPSLRLRRKGGSFSVAWWCRELRTLLQAGMTVVEALETLHLQAGGGEREAVHARLLRSLREGQSLSAAMAASGAFPSVLVASITASERTSTLVAALDDYLRYDDMLQRLRKQAVSAAIYPAVVVTLGSLIAVFLLLYVIPRFSRIYADFEGKLSTPTTLLLWTSKALHEHAAWTAAAVLAVIASMAIAWRRGWVQRGGAWLLARVEPLQRQWDHFRLAKLYQSLALMFRGGYTLDEGLAVCASLGLGVRLAGGVEQATRMLTRGAGVSRAFVDGGLCDSVSERLLAVGERTGNFDRVLQTIADRHADAFSTFVERATRIVEPVLLLLVALMVGGIVVLMYMPIFDIASSVQ